MLVFRVLSAAILALLLSHPARAQQEPPPEIQAMQRADTIRSLTTGRYGPLTPAQLQLAKAGGTTSVLESLFAQTTDHPTKTLIAFQLVRDKAPDPTYWRYLFELSTQAAAIDAPEFSPLDSLLPFPTPALKQWATEHSIANLPAEEARLRTLYDGFEETTLLNDPRLLPLLRTALISPNREVRTLAASSLASAHDLQSIPAVTRLLNATTGEEQQLIAHALLNFEDPAATAAANAVLPRNPSPLEKLRQGEFEPYNIQQAASEHLIGAIPLLKAEFNRTEDSDLKINLALGLIRFSLRTGIYWDYLYAQAQAVIESGAPPLYLPGPDTKTREISPAFITWAKAHDIPLDSRLIIYETPTSVIELSLVADQRTSQLFREGLSSDLDLVVMMSLEGLARVKDPEAVRFTVAECKRNPTEAVTWASRLLEYDDDPAAEQAVGHYLSPQMLAELKKSRALENARDNAAAPR